MDVDTLKIALSLTTLGLVLALAYGEYLGVQRSLQKAKAERRRR